MQKSHSIARENIELLSTAAAARSALLDGAHESGLRLFNGFYEGIPGLVADVYGRTLVLFNQAEEPESLRAVVQAAQAWYVERFPWLRAVIVKTRRSPAQIERNGQLTYGDGADERIREHGVWYALNIQMNQDASFYFDTRNLRAWLRERMHGRSVLNTFAYTGSLGAAAMAGGARQVIQTDRSRKFLALTRQTYELNGFAYRPEDLPVGDFHQQMGVYKRMGRLFDCVILDPPFFSITVSGRVDLAAEIRRLVNKVRPLVAHQGWLVAVNNALFVSGADYLAQLAELCQDGHLRIESVLPVPADLTGYPETRVSPPPVDPAPFNHPTKIAVLRVTRKDQAAAN